MSKQTMKSKKKNRKKKAKKNKKTNKVKRTYKDSIFRSLFNDEKTLRELYSALANSDVDPSAKIEIVTLENAIFDTIKNDLAFTWNNQLIIMIEQQSTDSPNLPVRMFAYLADEYKKLISDENIYGTKLVKLPTPELYVFYNGTKEKEEEWTRKMSEAYKVQREYIAADVEVKYININYEKGAELLEKCKTLQGYSILLHKVQNYMKETGDMQYSMEKAIEECIEEDVIAEFLRKHRGQVMSLLRCTLTEEQKERIRWNDAKREALEEARVEVRQELRQEVELSAKRFKAKGVPLDVIAECIGLPLATVEAI